MSKSKRILLGVCGSIAAYKAADIIRRFQDKDYQVSVIMTKEAEKFITPLTLGSLSGEKVYQDMFDVSQEAWAMTHIKLTRETAAFLVAPATANIIAKLANGLADDLITCTALVARMPLLIAPAMNEEMFHHPVVQENLSKLKKIGAHLIEPIKGRLACGIDGDGHLAEVDDIVKATLKLIK